MLVAAQKKKNKRRKKVILFRTGLNTFLKVCLLNKHRLYYCPVSVAFLNLRDGDKLQLQEAQSVVLHSLHVADLHFKEAENYGKSLNIGLKMFRNEVCLER